MEWYNNTTLWLGYFTLILAAGAIAELNSPSSGILKLFGKSIQINHNANINPSQELTLGRKRATPSLPDGLSNQNENASDMVPRHELFIESHQRGESSFIRSNIDDPPITNGGSHATGGGIIEREDNDSSHAEHIEFHLVPPCVNRSMENRISEGMNSQTPYSNGKRRKIARLDSSEPVNSSNQPAQVEKKNYEDNLSSELAGKSGFPPRNQNMMGGTSHTNCNNDINRICPLQQVEFLADSSKDYIACSPSYTLRNSINLFGIQASL
jgi:hypothetical protein